MAGHRGSYGKRSHSQSDYADNGGNKRRNNSDDRDYTIDSDDTVYRYLCPAKKIGSIIGRGGEIVKKLRAESKSKIRIGETVHGSDERVVTIYSESDETNAFDDTDTYVCPAQDALFRVHDRVVAEDAPDQDMDMDEVPQVTVRLLVPSDQIGCIIGKGGQIIQNIRSETGAQVRVLKDDHLPPCALSSDELLQVSGEAPAVRKALFQVSSRIHDNPSRSQHLLASSVPTGYQSGGGPVMGLTPLMGAYGGYKGDSGDWSNSYYSGPRDEASMKEFSIRMLCPTGSIGGVIGRSGVIIKQIRQDSGASIRVDSSAAEGEYCLINISTKEIFEDTVSPTISAAVLLQPRCSEKIERDSGITSFTTRLLVPNSRIGCLIGKGGAIISELRKMTKANIRILSKDDLPKVALEDDEMVQISGDLDVAKDALVQVATRLRANIFDREGAVPAYLPVLPYLPPMSQEGSDDYDSRDSKRHGRGYSYSSGYGGSSDLPSGDGYGSYGGSQIGGGSAYGAYGGYSSGRSGGSGLSGQNPVSSSRRKSHGY